MIITRFARNIMSDKSEADTITIKLLLNGEQIGVKFLTREQAITARGLLLKFCETLARSLDADPCTHLHVEGMQCQHCGIELTVEEFESARERGLLLSEDEHYKFMSQPFSGPEALLPPYKPDMRD